MFPELPRCYRIATKPMKLSDPHHDFSEEHLQELLSKEVADFAWHDFQSLFARYLPAGTYQEVKYYVHFFQDYLFKHDEDQLDLVDGWAAFCSKHFWDICADGAEKYILSSMRFLFAHLTNEFTIQYHLTGTLNHSHQHDDHAFYVKGSDVLAEWIDSLWEFKTHRDLVIEFLKLHSQFEDNIIKCKWFLELSASRFNVTNLPRDPMISKILANKERLISAKEYLLDTELNDIDWRDVYPAGYWIQTFRTLEI